MPKIRAHEGFNSRVVSPEEYDGQLLTALRAAQARADAAEARVRGLEKELAALELEKAELAMGKDL